LIELKEKQKFFSLGEGTGLSVALQSNIASNEDPIVYLKEGVDESQVLTNIEKGQIFHPGTILPTSEIMFAVITNGREEKKKLVFRAKHWTSAARFGEIEPFGFEKTNPRTSDYKGSDYVVLAFPGITGDFSQVFFKIRPRKKKPIFLKIKAWEISDINEKGVVVRSRRVISHEIPSHLHRG